MCRRRQSPGRRSRVAEGIIISLDASPQLAVAGGMQSEGPHSSNGRQPFLTSRPDRVYDGYQLKLQGLISRFFIANNVDFSVGESPEFEILIKYLCPGLVSAGGVLE